MLGARNPLEYNDENDGTPSRVNPIESPRRTPEKQEYFPQWNSLLSHFLLGVEVNRLMEVVKQYDKNLQNLTEDNEALEEENEKLKKEKNSQNQTINDLQRRLQAAQSQLAQQPRQVMVQQAPQQLPLPLPPPPPKDLNMNLTDFLHDDKNSLIQLLVRRNIENDRLRKEVEELKAGGGGKPSSPESDRAAKEILRKLAETFGNLKDKAPKDVTHDFEIVSLKAEGLRNKTNAQAVSNYPRTRESVPGLADSLKHLHMGLTEMSSYDKDKEALFDSMTSLLLKLMNGSQQPPIASQRSAPLLTESGSPQKEGPPSNQTIEYRTEIINGVPTKVKVIRKDPRATPSPTRPAPSSNQSFGEQAHGFTTSQPPQTAAKDYRADLANALKRINDLEVQNNLLLSKLDAQTIGRSDLLVPTSPMAQFIQANTSGTVAMEELRREILSLKNECSEWRYRLDKAELEKEKLARDAQDMKERADELQTDKEALQKKVKTLQEELDRLEGQVREEKGKTETEKRRGDAARRETEEEKERRDRDLHEAALIVQALKDKMKELERKVEEKQGAIEEGKEQLSEKMRASAAMEGRNRHLERANTEQDGKMKELEQSLAQKKRESDDLAQNVSNLERELRNSKDNEKSLREDLQEADNAVAFLKEKMEELAKEIQRLAKREKELSEECNQLEKDVRKRDEYIRRQEARHSSIMGKVVTSLGLIKTALPGTQRELAELKQESREQFSDFSNYLGSLESLLESKVELGPKGTMALLRHLKAKVGTEIPKLQSRVAQLEDYIERSEQDHKVLISKKDIEISDLKSKLADESAKHKRETQKLQDDLDDSNDENKRIKRDSERKDKQIEKLTKDLDDQIEKIESLKTKLGQFATSIDSSNHPVRVDGYRNPNSAMHTTPNFSENSNLQLMLETVLPPFGAENSHFMSFRPYEQQDSRRTLDSVGDPIGFLEGKLKETERKLKKQEEEIKTLKKGSQHSSEDKGDKVEMLKQKTEKMLSKTENKIDSLQKAGKASQRYLRECTQDCEQLRQKLADSNKKFMAEYIQVCQKAIDMYERLQAL